MRGWRLDRFDWITVGLVSLQSSVSILVLPVRSGREYLAQELLRNLGSWLLWILMRLHINSLNGSFYFSNYIGFILGGVLIKLLVYLHISFWKLIMLLPSPPNEGSSHFCFCQPLSKVNWISNWRLNLFRKVFCSITALFTGKIFFSLFSYLKLVQCKAFFIHTIGFWRFLVEEHLPPSELISFI